VAALVAAEATALAELLAGAVEPAGAAALVLLPELQAAASRPAAARATVPARCLLSLMSSPLYT
jgi:hypothetical protein